MTEQSMWDPPTVEITGDEYQFRRLGIKDLKGIYSIIQNISSFSLDEETVRKLQDDDADIAQAGMDALVEMLPEATDEIIDWLTDKLEDFDKDIEDPSEFPVHAPLTILNTLGEEHEDFKKFFIKSRKALKIIQKMTGSPSQDSSTESQSDTDGQTEKS